MKRWKLTPVLAAMICFLALGESAFALLVMIPAGSRVGGGSTQPKGWTELLEDEKIGTRVFGYWLNGDEAHFFAGDAESLNSFLKRAAEVQVKKRMLVFRPGKGEAEHSELVAERRKPLPCDWNIRLFAPIRTADDLTIDVFLGGGLDREKLRVPEGFDVVDRTKGK